MDFIDIDENSNEPEKKIKWNKKNILILVASILGIILCIVGISFYIAYQPFRDFFDQYILRKNIVENNAASIELNADSNQSVLAYDKYIAILEKNTLTTYNPSRKRRILT